MRWRLTITALFLASPLGAQTPDWSSDETFLRSQRLPTSGPALLQILRDRTPSAAIVRQFGDHAAQLRGARFRQRLQATADLIQMGPVVRPLLERQLNDARLEPETAARLRHVLDQFPADKDHAIVSAAARLIARDRPEDALIVLFDFVPHATNEAVRQETQRAIDAVGFVEKKPAPLLLAALKDASPARSAAACEALVRNLGADARKTISPLLRDPHPLVRYQAGLALVEKNDKSGLPLLIQTLADAPPDRVDRALEVLYRAAGDNAPPVVYRGKANAASFSTAWQKWHDQHAGALDLAAALAKNELGFTMVSTTAIRANTRNRIFELGVDKSTVRWEFEAPRYAIDAHVIGSNRVLMAEYYDRRVTERNLKGEVLWQTFVAMPIACQRLPNGQTFIAARQQLQIVDRDGQPVFTWPQQGASISAAQRLLNGQFALVTTGGRCILLDAQGNELKGFQMGPVYSMGGSIEVLPNGRILAPLYSQQCIAEFDWQGNKLWSASIARPIAATRLKNGNTLVTCSMDYRIVEIDRDGKEIWSMRTDGRPFHARRR